MLPHSHYLKPVPAQLACRLGLIRFHRKPYKTSQVILLYLFLVSIYTNPHTLKKISKRHFVQIEDRIDE